MSFRRSTLDRRQIDAIYQKIRRFEKQLGVDFDVREKPYRFGVDGDISH